MIKMKSIFALLLVLFFTSCEKGILEDTVYELSPDFVPEERLFNVFETSVEEFDCRYENNPVLAEVKSSYLSDTSQLAVSWYEEEQNGNLLLLSNDLSQRFTTKGPFVLKFKGYVKEIYLDTTIKFDIPFCEAYVEFPNVFEPNEDQLFDTWAPIGEGILSIDFVVTDTQGVKLFSSTSIGNSWDGTSQNVKMPTGTYNYRCSGLLKNGYNFSSSGAFELIRVQ